MSDFFLHIVTLSASIYIWGIFRTALWLLPTLFFPFLMPAIAGSLLTFWVITGFLTPYKNGAFDLRDVSRGRWIVIFILTGLSPVGIPDPLSFAVGFIAPPLALLIFRLCKHPANEILLLPKGLRWFLLCLWLICLIWKILDYPISNLLELDLRGL